MAVRDKALKEALSYKEDIFGTCIKALVAIVPHLESEDRDTILWEALASLESPATQYTWHDSLALVAPLLTEPLLAKALDIIEKQAIDLLLPSALQSIAPFLPKSLYQRALEIVYSHSDEKVRTMALISLAPILSVSRRNNLLEVTFSELKFSPDHLIILIPYLQKRQQKAAVIRAIEALHSAKWYSQPERARRVMSLAPYLSADQRTTLLDQTLVDTLTTPIDSRRIEALTILISALSEKLIAKALDMTLSLTEGEERRKLLEILAPYVSLDSIPRLLIAATQLDDYSSQAKALTELAKNVDEHQRAYILEAAMRAAIAVKSDLSCVGALRELAFAASEPLRTRIVEAGLHQVVRSQEMFRNLILESFAPALPSTTAVEALKLVVYKDGLSSQVRVLAALSVRLPIEQQKLLSSLFCHYLRVYETIKIRRRCLRQLLHCFPKRNAQKYLPKRSIQR